MARRHNKEEGDHLEQESNTQRTIKDIDGGLHPVVDGQSLGERCEKSKEWKIKYKGKVYNLPWTAIQSFTSSPGGNLTTSFRSMPELREALACLWRLYFSVPRSNRFFGRNVWNTQFVCKENQITCSQKEGFTVSYYLKNFVICEGLGFRKGMVC